MPRRNHLWTTNKSGVRWGEVRVSKLLRCGAQTPSDRHRGHVTSPRDTPILSPRRWRVGAAPHSGGVYSHARHSHALLTFAALFITLLPAHAEKNLRRPPGTTRYRAMVQKLDGLLRYDQAHDKRLALTSLGTSVRGRTLWMVTLSAGGKKCLFYLCRQHGHEPASTEGALAFISELVKADASTPLADALKTVTVFVVPMANPDGAEAFLRHNAQDVDLNRDWIKRSQPETRALYAEISRLHPDLMSDQHELYPDDTRPDFTEAVGPGSGAAPGVIDSGQAAQKAVADIMEAAGFAVVSHEITDTHPARLAHRFFSIKLGIPTLLFETNRLSGSGRTVARRAAAQEAFMAALLTYAAADNSPPLPSEKGSE